MSSNAFLLGAVVAIAAFASKPSDQSLQRKIFDDLNFAMQHPEISDAAELRFAIAHCNAVKTRACKLEDIGVNGRFETTNLIFAKTLGINVTNYFGKWTQNCFGLFGGWHCFYSEKLGEPTKA